MRLADLGTKVVLGQSVLDPRDEITAIGLVIDVLELASPAFREMAAWRVLVMRPRRKRAVVEQGIARNAPRHMTAT